MLRDDSPTEQENARLTHWPSAFGRWLDRPVLDRAIGLRSARLDRALTGFTHLGGPTGMTIIASMITLLMLWRWRSRTPLILMITTVAGSLLITVVGKAVVGRSRPPVADAVPPYESSPSFPSGHALNSTVIAGMVAYLLLRRLSSPLARRWSSPRRSAGRSPSG